MGVAHETNVRRSRSAGDLVAGDLAALENGQSSETPSPAVTGFWLHVPDAEKSSFSDRIQPIEVLPLPERCSDLPMTKFARFAVAAFATA